MAQIKHTQSNEYGQVQLCSEGTKRARWRLRIHSVSAVSLWCSFDHQQFDSACALWQTSLWTVCRCCTSVVPRLIVKSRDKSCDTLSDARSTSCAISALSCSWTYMLILVVRCGQCDQLSWSLVCFQWTETTPKDCRALFTCTDTHWTTTAVVSRLLLLLSFSQQCVLHTLPLCRVRWWIGLLNTLHFYWYFCSFVCSKVQFWVFYKRDWKYDATWCTGQSLTTNTNIQCTVQSLTTNTMHLGGTSFQVMKSSEIPTNLCLEIC